MRTVAIIALFTATLVSAGPALSQTRAPYRSRQTYRLHRTPPPVFVAPTYQPPVRWNTGNAWGNFGGPGGGGGGGGGS